MPTQPSTSHSDPRSDTRPRPLSSSSPSSSPLQPSDDPIRERLVEAATAVFAERGYDGARVGDIARRAGLTTGAIYSNFSGKAQLLAAAIAAQSTTELQGMLSVLLSEKSSGERLAVMGRLLLRGPALPAHSLVLDAVAAARRDPDLAQELRGQIEHGSQRVARLIDGAKAEGSIDPTVPTDVLVRFCLTLLFGSVTLKAIGFPAPDHGDWTALIDRVTAAFTPRSVQ